MQAPHRFTNLFSAMIIFTQLSVACGEDDHSLLETKESEQELRSRRRFPRQCIRQWQLDREYEHGFLIPWDSSVAPSEPTAPFEFSEGNDALNIFFSGSSHYGRPSWTYTGIFLSYEAMPQPLEIVVQYIDSSGTVGGEVFTLNDGKSSVFVVPGTVLNMDHTWNTLTLPPGTVLDSYTVVSPLDYVPGTRFRLYELNGDVQWCWSPLEIDAWNFSDLSRLHP